MREITALFVGAATYRFTHQHVTEHNNKNFGSAAGAITGTVATITTYTALSLLTWLSGVIYAAIKSIHDFSKNPSLTTEAVIFASATTAILIWKQMSRNPNSPTFRQQKYSF